MEIFKHLIDDYISKNLDAHEWRMVEPPPGSPFLGIHRGEVKAVYQRTWSPTVVRLLWFGLPFLALILFLLMIIYLFGEVELPIAISPIVLRGFQLGLLAIVLVLLFLLVKNQLATWPTRTPRRVAVLGSGLAWLEGEALRFWYWEEIKAVRIEGYFLVIERKSGEVARFHAGLYGLVFGR